MTTHRRTRRQLAKAMQRSRAALNQTRQTNDHPSRFAPPFCAVLGYHPPERDVTNGTKVCVHCRKELP